MAKPEKPETKETHQRITRQIPKFSRDLLQRFTPSSSNNNVLTKREQTEEEIELTLGLSLNGRFGVDPKANGLSRCTSIPDFIINNPKTKDTESPFFVPLPSPSGIGRTCSMPVETEETWRKRKELQSMRRMEAKRKRTEKQRNSMVVKREELNNMNNENLGLKVEDGRSACVIEKKIESRTGLVTDANLRKGLPEARPGFVSQRSVGSVGVSGVDSHPIKGMNHKYTESRSPTSVQSLSESEAKPTKPENTTGSCMEKKSENRTTLPPKGVKEAVRNILEDMPGVSTTGDGPNGKRIQGFLYRYGKGEEVSILCVCHGRFLSPAEFVKHAGGTDVPNPLKHIVVNHSSFL